MEQNDFDEIVSILAKFGRPDLIQEFKQYVKVDEDYVPPRVVRRDKYSDDEYSAESESDYEIEIDQDGFHSLK